VLGDKDACADRAWSQATVRALLIAGGRSLIWCASTRLIASSVPF
jgi:hypothetical protein